MICSLLTLRVREPTWILVGRGVGLLLRRLGDLDLKRDIDMIQVTENVNLLSVALYRSPCTHKRSADDAVMQQYVVVHYEDPQTANRTNRHFNLISRKSQHPVDAP